MAGYTEERRQLHLGDGVRAFFGGIAFIVTTPRVWGYALVPVTVLLLLGCLLGAAGFWGAFKTASAVIGSTQSGWSQAGWWAITVGLGLTFLILGALLSLVLAQPLSGWALEGIARAQERALIGTCSPEVSFLESLWCSVKVALFTVVVGGTITGTLLLIAFVFPPAAAVTVPLKFFVISWLLAWTFIDYPLGLRGVGIRQRFVWVYQHFSAFTIFGMAWATVIIVPGMAFLLLPMGVAGGTRLVVTAEGPPEEVDW